jgi:hypothetical protein
LPAGTQDAGQNLLGAGAVRRTIASPGFARQRHQPDRPRGEVVGGMQAGTVKEGEQVWLLMAQMFGQSLIGRRAKVAI